MRYQALYKVLGVEGSNLIPAPQSLTAQRREKGHDEETDSCHTEVLTVRAQERA